MKAMDTIIEVRTPRVEWARVAETMLEQLSVGEQAEIRTAIDDASRHFEPSRLKLITPARSDARPFYILPISERLLAFITREDGDHLRVLDVMRREQLAAFRDDRDIAVGDGTQTEQR
jgi:hypothetical protein